MQTKSWTWFRIWFVAVVWLLRELFLMSPSSLAERCWHIACMCLPAVPQECDKCKVCAFSHRGDWLNQSRTPHLNHYRKNKQIKEIPWPWTILRSLLLPNQRFAVLLQFQDDFIKGEYVLPRTCRLWDCMNLLGFAEQLFLAEWVSSVFSSTQPFFIRYLAVELLDPTVLTLAGTPYVMWSSN